MKVTSPERKTLAPELSNRRGAVHWWGDPAGPAWRTLCSTRWWLIRDCDTPRLSDKVCAKCEAIAKRRGFTT